MENIVKSIDLLLELLAKYGGKIVSTNNLDVFEINQARASGRMYVDDKYLGYCWIPDFLKFPQSELEIELFDKWYPLDVDVPKELTEKTIKRILKK